VVVSSNNVSRWAHIILLDSSRLWVSGRSWSSVGKDSESSSGNSSDVQSGKRSAGRRFILSGERRMAWDEVSKQEFLRLGIRIGDT
jgi:hypothetical protein